MPRAKKDPNAPKVARAVWTDSKICFILNEFLTEKEDGNMIGGNWKPVAYTNVHERYTLAYPEDKVNREQIKNLYTTSKSSYTGMKKVKMTSGVGWVGGKIDMPNEWWENVGKKDKDAMKLRNNSFDYYKEMDAMLHGSKPAGALRTGTSSGTRVEAEDNEEEEIEIIDHDNLEESKEESRYDEVDAQGLTQAERDLDDLPDSDEEVSTEKGKGKAIVSDSQNLDLPTPKNPTTVSTIRKEGTKPSTSKSTPVSNIKKKMPARKVKPVTLATAIASASDNLAIKAQEKADRSAQLNSAITEAARIKADKLPNLQKALELFNPASKDQFPNLDDRLISIDVISQEAKAAVFGGLDPKMRWVWLKAQVNVIKEAREKNQGSS
ncbi:uncharacterized protein MELLADRAFT_90420 [Melampsora larici-populina 98AG31]|uniref:Myb/SANT-like domain-containing protein n=1 Tax=Melampsora larici-populina (strain 98AG31 / pathotype 3-4-7) TaxID=747676 RepID=F4RWV4_MELLP|nr:uncharacterized protein MELLADRAFT_90420 [Melampsora larici-populina 98AG31]EGG03159.1 hypothetical protein MELLADRAFT_90420 [Melampsora larici-populina 98AG31]